MRLLATVLLFLIAATPALASGGPVTAIQGGTGAQLPDGSVSYIAVGLRHRTVVQRVRRGAVRYWVPLRGSWGVPGVTWESGTGLSGDGRTLVLAEMTRRYPVRRSRFAVLGARRLDVRERFSLPGFFTVDAISPDARWLYLTHYTSRTDIYDYEIRAYDLRRHRLLPEPVVDRREPDEEMAGTAVGRASTADGRWAYTLYQRPRGELFVHALDTARRTAFCIDLDDVFVYDPYKLRLRLDGALLHVGDKALIDTRTFAVLEPGLPLFAAAAANLSSTLRAGSSAVRAADS